MFWQNAMFYGYTISKTICKANAFGNFLISCIKTLHFLLCFFMKTAVTNTFISILSKMINIFNQKCELTAKCRLGIRKSTLAFDCSINRFVVWNNRIGFYLGLQSDFDVFDFSFFYDKNNDKEIHGLFQGRSNR